MSDATEQRTPAADLAQARAGAHEQSGQAGTNPYAPPEADLTKASVEEQGTGPVFVQMPVSRLALVTVFTFGIYHAVWFWRQWTRVQRNGEELNRFWRVVFSPFMFFTFVDRVRASAVANEVTLPKSLSAAPVIYLLSSVGMRVFDRLGGESYSGPFFIAEVLLFAGYTSAVCMAQAAVNSVTRKAYPNATPDPLFTLGTVVALVVGLLIFMAIAFTSLREAGAL